ncbi:MAG TPA: DUF4232 domain-containing protein [Acidimicrobiales bacterium]|nr:DUF4232 domain-containing protein [Acidimicrobiales bacterium]
MPPRRGLTPVLCLAAIALSGCSLLGTSAASTTTTSAVAPTSSDTTTTTTTTTTAPTSTTSSSTTTTTPAVPNCSQSSVTIEPGQSSGAAGTIALGFVITNTTPSTCRLDGYPTITLVPVSGTVHAVISHVGTASRVILPGRGGAGFVLEYTDEAVNGQTTCPKISATDVRLPHAKGTPITVPTRFCPYGQPNVSLSAVLSLAKYQALVG